MKHKGAGANRWRRLTNRYDRDARGPRRGLSRSRGDVSTKTRGTSR